MSEDDRARSAIGAVVGKLAGDQYQPPVRRPA
jgi:hypothetical protein